MRPRVLKQKRILRTASFEIFRAKIQLRDGRRTRYNYIHTNGGVVVFALDTHGRMACVRQWRAAINHVELEPVSGGVKHGQTPLRSAKEELEEEVGFHAKKWECVAKLSSWAGPCDEYASIFIAKELLRVGSHLEENEDLDLEWHSVASFDRAIAKGEVTSLFVLGVWSVVKPRILELTSAR